MKDAIPVILPPHLSLLKIMLEDAEIDFEEVNEENGTKLMIDTNSFINCIFDDDGKLVNIEVE